MLKSDDLDTADAAADASGKVAAVRNASTAAMAAAGIATRCACRIRTGSVRTQTLAEIRALWGRNVKVGNPLTGNADGVQVTLDSNGTAARPV